MRQHIDEPGGHSFTGDVDFARGPPCNAAGNRNNAASLYGDIAYKR